MIHGIDAYILSAITEENSRTEIVSRESEGKGRRIHPVIKRRTYTMLQKLKGICNISFNAWAVRWRGLSVYIYGIENQKYIMWFPSLKKTQEGKSHKLMTP
jgi:hypothetical protein